MSSFSERASSQRANNYRQPREGLEARREPTSMRPAYMPNPGPRLRLVPSNGMLMVKAIPLAESTAPATEYSEPELHIPAFRDLPNDQDSYSDEGSATSITTNEKPTKTGINSESTNEVVKSAQAGAQEELSTSGNMAVDERHYPEDEESSIDQRLAILQSRFKNLERNKAEASKQLITTGSQLGEPQLATIDAMVTSEQQTTPIESKNAKEISDLQKLLLQAESEKEEFRRNFQDAQEQIFSMQPRRSDITENEAAEEYGSLCANVDHWIDSHLDEVLNQDYNIFAHSDVDILSGSQLLELIEITSGAINAKDVPGTLLYYLRSAVINFICREIFQQELYCADSGPWKLFHIIETSMHSLEPRRDRATIRAWRNETLTALIASPDYKNARHPHARKLASHLCGCIEVLLPRTSKAQLASLKESLIQDLILPALTLSERFQVSGKLFSLSGRGANIDAVQIAQELGIYECRNFLHNGKLVKTLPHGADCEYLMDIYPGLYCRDLKVDALSAPKLLKKAQILVAVRKPDKYHDLHGDTALGHIFRSIEVHNMTKSREIENPEAEKKRSNFWL